MLKKQSSRHVDRLGVIVDVEGSCTLNSRLCRVRLGYLDECVVKKSGSSTDGGHSLLQQDELQGVDGVENQKSREHIEHNITSSTSRGKLLTDEDAEEGDADGGHHHGTDGHHDEIPRYKLPFYSLPHARYKWKQGRAVRHPSWDDLYFDLILVGVIFQAGQLLAVEISGSNFFVFLSIILLLFQEWWSRLIIGVTIVLEDNVHRFLQLVQGLLLAYAAHNVSSTERLKDYSNNSALMFSICILLCHVLRMLIWGEIVMFEKEELNARAYAVRVMVIEMGSTFALVGAILLILFQANFYIVAALWLLSYIFSKWLWIAFAFFGVLSEATAIPWDVNYAILRMGNVTMLMLGEGVLQIIIYFVGDVDDKLNQFSAGVSALFVISYFIMGLLQLLHYSTLPFRPEEHVLLSSRKKAVVFLELFTWYSVSQICVGVALKKLLLIQTEIDDRFYKYYKRTGYYWFFAVSLTCLSFLLACQQVIHLNIGMELGFDWFHEEEDQTARMKWLKRFKIKWRPHSLEKKRVWVFRFIIYPSIFLILGGCSKLYPVYVALIAFVILFALLCFQVISGRFKRKRKFNRVVALIVAIGKLKRMVALRRLAKKEQEQQHQHDLLLEEEEKEDGGRRPSLSNLETTGSGSNIKVRRKSSSSRIIHIVSTSKAVKTVKRGMMDTFREFRQVMNIYSCPSVKLDWENLHEYSNEVNWFVLFFDLTFVAVAFRLNDLSFDGQLTGLGGGSIWLYFGQFLAIFDCWMAKTNFESMFASPDVAHRFLDLIQGCLIAFMAANIFVDTDWQQYIDIYMPRFAGARLLYELTMLALGAEIYFTYKRRDHFMAAHSGKRLMSFSIIKLVSIAISYWPISQGNKAIAVLFWAIPFYITYVSLLIQIVVGHLQNSNSVPLDIHYVVHRLAELALIMIGEGVVSIIISTGYLEKNHYVNFTIGFFMLNVLRLLYFSTERFDVEKMAARKSRVRGIAIAIIRPIIFCSISAVGGLSIWSLVEQPDSEFLSFKAEIVYFAIPYMLFVFTLWITDLVQEGLDELKCFTVNKWVAIAMISIYALKFYFVAQFALIVWAHWNSTEMLGSQFCTLILSYVLHIGHVELREFTTRKLGHQNKLEELSEKQGKNGEQQTHQEEEEQTHQEKDIVLTLQQT